MLVLAIDTATPAVTTGVVALERAGTTVLGTRVTVDPRAHGELLTPHVLEATRDAGVTPRELAAVVCGSGPGPYTGLRAGMVTAAALAHALGIPAHPVCSLDGIAAEVDTGEPFLVITDARRREVYWAAYDASGTRTDGPHVAPPAELAARATGRPAAGHGAELYRDVLDARVVGPAYPGVAGLVAAAAPELLAGAEPAPLTPRYLRRPDAREPGRPKRVSTA
ncbi:tRNA threonylcarbamoyl adenosine modification protein YeaZ [Amycolatopsis arida]|uniref:tRNA threonylcarbamoyl adenosine modification protein YeaZ n=1 Tax=Amycolatopsis arida TaxID=587909 RepID=A0A1I5X102_9PSEU|nr:tRNA (adenosine(37)-N6)-threonylcarbamoyltransferase complex dimerization subunit type 1 TsaB [Amycolatopsis arida]TDX92550.1 tRNA threonylcarbamoyl adenosine modification protein YeaZ [Amycolatopsis arida]SFQ25639.1 tRNA threonylcarbamoyl adenosine modification protein YeaZ [Amycolatopsis arida]